MASNHYKVNREIEVNLKLKVNVETIHNYHQMTEEQKENVIEELKEDLPGTIKYILENSSDFIDHNNLMGCDWVTLSLKK